MTLLLRNTHATQNTPRGFIVNSIPGNRTTDKVNSLSQVNIIVFILVNT